MILSVRLRSTALIAGMPSIPVNGRPLPRSARLAAIRPRLVASSSHRTAAEISALSYVPAGHEEERPSLAEPLIGAPAMFGMLGGAIAAVTLIAAFARSWS